MPPTPIFIAESPWQTSLIFSIIRISRQGFTLETEEFPSNKKPYLTLVGQHAMANREKITVTSIKVEDTEVSYKVLMSGTDKNGMERWGAHEEFKAKGGQDTHAYAKAVSKCQRNLFKVLN